MSNAWPILFEVPTPLGFRVRTSPDYWQKIVTKHPDLAGCLEAVKAALRPELVPVTIPSLSLDHLPHLALEGTGIRPASLYDQLYEVDEGEWSRETESHSREVESGKEVAR